MLNNIYVNSQLENLEAANIMDKDQSTPIFRPRKYSENSTQYTMISGDKDSKIKPPYNYSSAIKPRNLPKPDFSSIEQKERNIEFKEFGSYKKAKNLFPKSPLKSPKKRLLNEKILQTNPNFKRGLFTFLNFEIDEDKKEEDDDDNLNVPHPSNMPCRKLNFFNMNIDNQSQQKPQQNMKRGARKYSDCTSYNVKASLFNNTNSSSNNSKEKKEESNLFNSIFQNNQDDSACENDVNENINIINFERDFKIIKSISEKSHRNELFICEENSKKNKIYLIKKSNKNSLIPQVLQVLNLIKKNQNSNDILSHYLIEITEAWTEYDDLSLKKILYIKSPYYEKGDLLDYLTSLHSMNSPKINDINFYWDLIFNMICSVHYLHKFLKIAHFNIQPSNFLIDNYNHLLLTGFSFSKIMNDNDMNNSYDFPECDNIYISPELFQNFHFNKNLNYFKCDIFSLGLSILEIVSNINLPENGRWWKEIRSPGYQIPSEIFDKWIVKDINILNLINKMIIFEPNNRPSAEDILNNKYEFPELYNRFKNMSNLNINELINSNNIIEHEDDDEEMYSINKDFTLLNFKRTNSSKGLFDY